MLLQFNADNQHSPFSLKYPSSKEKDDEVVETLVTKKISRFILLNLMIN